MDLQTFAKGAEATRVVADYRQFLIERRQPTLIRLPDVEQHARCEEAIARVLGYLGRGDAPGYIASELESYRGTQTREALPGISARQRFSIDVYLDHVAALRWALTAELERQHCPPELRRALAHFLADYETAYLSVVNHSKSELTRLAQKNASLAGMQRKLEHEVQLRTAELRQALSELRQLDRLKADFLATVSHELRTPLHTLLSYGTTLIDELMGPLNPEQEQAITTMLHASERLLAMVNDLLDLNKLESGALTVRIERTDYAPLVESVVEMMRPLAESKGLRLTTELPEDPPEVLADPERLHQVLRNLLSNAVKFSVEGEIAVRVRAAGPQIETEVQDQGPGIPADALPKLFDRFYQVNVADARGGTGIGLNLVKSLLEAMGGAIAVESAPGAGSCFRFGLPAHH